MLKYCFDSLRNVKTMEIFLCIFRRCEQEVRKSWDLWKKWRSVKVVIFSLCFYYLPIEKGHGLRTLEYPQSKAALYTLWLKLVSCFWEKVNNI